MHPKANPSSAAQPIFEIGPDKGRNIQLARSYFLVPLLGLDPINDSAFHQERIANADRNAKYTDIYVFSHGWHRNLFGAVSAYDCLVSRFTSLYQRGRLQPKTPSFRPLFLAMHWNSDPGEDGWVDRAGRRDKLSFIQRAQAAFEPEPSASDGSFLNILEDLYEFMTYVSSPDVPALTNPMTGKASVLYNALDQNADVRGRLSSGSATQPEDKVTLIWRCYEEAAVQRVLADQSEPAHPFSSPLQALLNLFKFVVALLGFTALFGLLPQLIHLSPLAPLWTTALGLTFGSIHSVSGWVEVIFTLLGTAMVLLIATMTWHQLCRKGKGARGLPVLAVGSWIPLQLFFTAPLLIYLFSTFLFRSWLILLAPMVYYLGVTFFGEATWPLTAFVLLCLAFSYFRNGQDISIGSLFNERVANSSLGNKAIAPVRFRDWLAIVARLPIGWLTNSVSQDSQVLGLAGAIDRQLAFWGMQREAVKAGQEAGIFLEGLFQQMAAVNPQALTNARVHLIGHSFGGLVIVNAARYLAQNTTTPLHSMTLLEAALGSSWFSTEPWCREETFLKGALACIFSSYDSANGFYYPAANNGRMAAGYVGMCEVGSKSQAAQRLGKDGLFASLVQPPDLSQYLEGQAPYALNLDASRLIFAGSVATGGGHDDIYKDDVIHMIWAITAL